MSAPEGHEWRRRPVLSWGLRIGVFVVPIALSFLAALLVSEHLPRITDTPSALLWIAAIGGGSLLTLFVFERAARRLLPLAALLDICLLFPDRAPARFAVARRSGRQKDLQASLRRAQAAGHLDDATRMRTVIELVLALSVHDRATRGHSERVRVFTDMVAQELNIPESGRARLRWAAILHDIGKLEVPTSTLNKEGKPTEDEWVALHRHPEEGAHLVGSLLPWFAEWGTAVEQHHERFDGTGYPHGLKGDEISLAARVVSLADVYEVMTAPRSYKRPMSVAAARTELIRVAGTQLDPTVVRAFLNLSVGRLWRTVGFGAWLAQFPLLGRLASSFTGWATPGVATAGAAAVIALSGFAGAVGPDHDFVVSASTSPPIASIPFHSAGVVTPGTDGYSGDTPRRSGQAPVVAQNPATQPAASGSAGVAPAPGALPAPTAAAGSSAPAPPGGQGGVRGVTSPPVPTPPVTSTTTTGCTACGNPSPSCVSHCSGNNNPSCTSYCDGNHNTSCRAYCYGNDDVRCTAHCDGNQDLSCTEDCSGNHGRGATGARL